MSIKIISEDVFECQRILPIYLKWGYKVESCLTWGNNNSNLFIVLRMEEEGEEKRQKIVLQNNIELTAPGLNIFKLRRKKRRFFYVK